MKKMNIVICALLLSMLGGCFGQLFSSDSIFAPKPLRIGGPDRKNASPEYIKGWDDGCETGMSTLVAGYYKSFYGYKQDPYMINNTTYYQAWKDAYRYCGQYAFRYSWDSFDRTYNKALENQLCIICPNEYR